MDIIESYRSMVVGAVPAEKQEATDREPVSV